MFRRASWCLALVTVGCAGGAPSFDAGLTPVGRFTRAAYDTEDAGVALEVRARGPVKILGYPSMVGPRAATDGETP